MRKKGCNLGLLLRIWHKIVYDALPLLTKKSQKKVDKFLRSLKKVD